MEAARIAPGGPGSPSPWEKADREKQKKLHQADVTRLRDTEIADLASRPYRNAEEEDRLQRLRLDQEFQRRVEEAEKNEEEGRNSEDDDLTNRPGVS